MRTYGSRLGSNSLYFCSHNSCPINKLVVGLTLLALPFLGVRVVICDTCRMVLFGFWFPRELLIKPHTSRFQYSIPMPGTGVSMPVMSLMNGICYF